MHAFKMIQELYHKMRPLIASLNLHNDTIKYYANWVRKAGLYQINQLQPNKRYLYLTCFIIHQYQLRQDILADILLTCVQATENAIGRAQKEQGYRNAGQKNQTLTLLSAARISYKSLLEQIETVALSQTLDDPGKIIRIKKLLDDYHHHTDEPKLDELTQGSFEQIATQDYYCVLNDLSLKLQNRAADILRHLAFDNSVDEKPSPILHAIHHYQAKLGNIGKEAPIDFLNEEEQSALHDKDGKFRVSLYKALLFFQLW